MSSTHAADPDAPTGILKSIKDEEPVMATAFAIFLLSNIGAILAHFHVLDLQHWSALSDGLVAPLAGVIAVPLGWLVRKAVSSPKTMRVLQSQLEAAKRAKDEAEAKAATSSAPIVVQVAGQQLSAVLVDSQEKDELDGLPALAVS
ncbi:MAG TPA: hypothetical protein VHO01_16415 [Jatrophihabitans sp.]|nr:hypothetical protein [Jatrophihabitans sp.]